MYFATLLLTFIATLAEQHTLEIGRIQTFQITPLKSEIRMSVSGQNYIAIAGHIDSVANVYLSKETPPTPETYD
jgi:hypothetical protein